MKCFQKTFFFPQRMSQFIEEMQPKRVPLDTSASSLQHVALLRPQSPRGTESFEAEIWK